MTLPFSLIFLGWPPLKSHFFSYGPPPNPTRPPYLIKNERSLKSPRICFQGTKYEIYREHVAYLHSILWRRARLWLELFASTVGRSLSWISYLFSYDFLRRRRSFTLRKLYVCLVTFLCFLQLSARAYVSLARCIGLFLLWLFWHHMIQM